MVMLDWFICKNLFPTDRKLIAECLGGDLILPSSTSFTLRSQRNNVDFPQRSPV